MRYRYLLSLLLCGLLFGEVRGQSLDVVQALLCSSDQFRLWQSPGKLSFPEPVLDRFLESSEPPNPVVSNPTARAAWEMALQAEDLSRNVITDRLDGFDLFLLSEPSMDEVNPLHPWSSVTLPDTFPIYTDPTYDVTLPDTFPLQVGPTYDWDLTNPGRIIDPDFGECGPVPAPPETPPFTDTCDTCVEVDDGNSPLPLQVITVTPVISSFSAGGSGLVGTATVTKPLLDPLGIDEFLRNSSLGVDSRDWLLGVVDHTFLILTRVSRSGFQPNTFPCTGTLVDGSTILTANHCMKFYTKVGGVKVSYCDGTIENIIAIHATGQVYKVETPENWTCDQVLDVLALRLQTPISFQPAPSSSRLREAQTGENLFAINYRPESEDGEITLVMYIQADCIVKRAEPQDTRFSHVCDTQGGASGSMLYSTLDRSPIGLHISGSASKQENYAVKLSAIPGGYLPAYIASSSPAVVVLR